MSACIFECYICIFNSFFLLLSISLRDIYDPMMYIPHVDFVLKSLDPQEELGGGRS